MLLSPLLSFHPEKKNWSKMRVHFRNFLQLCTVFNESSTSYKVHCCLRQQWKWHECENLWSKIKNFFLLFLSSDMTFHVILPPLKIKKWNFLFAFQLVCFPFMYQIPEKKKKLLKSTEKVKFTVNIFTRSPFILQVMRKES